MFEVLDRVGEVPKMLNQKMHQNVNYFHTILLMVDVYWHVYLIAYAWEG